ncbi:hypothetical protein [Duganella qianjiadongensis]|uniref:DUF4365 domain-containing protein n=1 Tax=Duganella qianjiadongensis TaxID=2692176 RepID=A0ABW9VT21_9BURK|nr:hypothetical protein [Duganella qianjiadongensis]MYM42216.1 hypothetical protein [Duganella qianjiadongensis]
MSPDFSEFSYGYAVTEEIVAANKATLAAAPLFPSLYQEGKAGGGYDVEIPLQGIPVFLQFKLSDCLERTNSKEYDHIIPNLPYYRMYLRPRNHSDQHKLLINLENSGQSVFYIAPEFHLPSELNKFYLSKTVISNSAAFSPLDLGLLPDDEQHYVVFERGTSMGYFCSDNPKEVQKTSITEGLRNLILSRGVQPRQLGEQGLRNISEHMLEILSRERYREDPSVISMPLYTTRLQS